MAFGLGMGRGCAAYVAYRHVARASGPMVGGLDWGAIGGSGLAKSCLEREARSAPAWPRLAAQRGLAGPGADQHEIPFSTPTPSRAGAGADVAALGIARLGERCFACGNMERISSYITYGDMDFILLKPISSQFAATLRYIDIYRGPADAHQPGADRYAFRLM